MTTEPATLARTAIQKLLDGAAPNGIAPESCGQWRETVSALYAEYHNDGTPGVQRLFNNLVRAHPDLARLVAGGDLKEHPWTPPLPFVEISLPPFPLDAFPQWLRDFCLAVTEAMQTPPDLAGMLALSVLSTCCARYVQVEAWQNYVEPVNVYTVTSLPPGSRKSPVFRALMNPLIHWEQQQKRDVEIARKKAEAEHDILKQMLEGAKSEVVKAKHEEARERAREKVDTLSEELAAHVVPELPRLVVDDVTPEALATFLADQQGRLACLSSEGDIFSIMAGRYSSGTPNIGVYKLAYTGETIRVDRRTRSDYVDHAALTVGITTQPDVLRRFGTNASFRGEGLLARFFYALPHSTVGGRDVTPRPVSTTVQQEYEATIRELLAYAAHCGNSGNSVSPYRSVAGYDDHDETILSERDSAHQEAENTHSVNSINRSLDDFTYLSIYLDENSRERFIDFMRWLEPQLGENGTFSSLVDWASKLGGSVLRIAGLLHMADRVCHNCHNRQNSITLDQLERAIQIAEYLIPHAYAAYAEVGADPLVQEARRIITWLENERPERFTKRDAYRALTGTFKRAADLDSPLELLVDRGYIRPIDVEERPGRAGRPPSPPYDVNPLVFSSKRSDPTLLPTFQR